MVRLAENNSPDRFEKKGDIFIFDVQKADSMKPLELISNLSHMLQLLTQIAPVVQKTPAQTNDKQVVDELIKNEELDTTGFTFIYQFWSEKSPDIMKSFVEPWGKLMQVEMKKQGLTHLTPQLIDQTSKRILAGTKLTQDQIDCGIAWMGVIWKFGDQLAKLTQNQSYPDIPLIKALTHDGVEDFYNSYVPPKIKRPNDAIENAGNILAHILQNEHLVNRFVKKVSEDPEILKWIPILHIPEKKRDFFLKQAADIAKKIIRKNTRNNPHKRKNSRS